MGANVAKLYFTQLTGSSSHTRCEVRFEVLRVEPFSPYSTMVVQSPRKRSVVGSIPTAGSNFDCRSLR